MKRLYILLFLLTLFSCSQTMKHPNISGKIKTEGNSSPNTFYVGLYNLSRFFIGEPLEFREQSEDSFSLDVAPGQYTLVVYTLETEMMRQHILIPDQNTRIRLEISLPPRGLDEDIESVTLVGEFCEWDQKKGVNLISREGIWTLGNESPLKKGDRYYFIVNDQVVYDVLEKNVEAVKKGAGLRNIYSGDKIVFDPSNYRHPVKKATARVEGFDLHDEYNRLQEDLVTFDYEAGGLLRKSSTLEKNDYSQSYSRLITKLDAMENNYDEFFGQAWLDKRLDTIVYCHPVYMEYSQLREAGNVEGETLEEFFSSERFEDFFSKHLELSKNLDPDSILLEGEFVDTLYF